MEPFLWTKPDSPSYNFWQFILFLRSTGIVASWLFVDQVIRKTPQILPLAYHSLRVEKSVISAFGTNIVNDKLPRARSSILSAYSWVALCVIFLSVMYLWSALVVSSNAYNLASISGWNHVVDNCLGGFDCYALDESSDLDFKAPVSTVIKHSLWWNLQPVCNKFVPLSKEEAEAVFKGYEKGHGLFNTERRHSVAMCHRLLPVRTWSQAMGTLALTLTIPFVAKSVFEVVATLLLKHTRRQHFNRVNSVDILCLVLLLAFVYLTIFNSFFGVSASANDDACLAVIPILLFQARRVAVHVKALRDIEYNARLKELHSTALGQEIKQIVASCVEEHPVATPPSPRNVSFIQRMTHRRSADGELSEAKPPV